MKESILKTKSFGLAADIVGFCNKYAKTNSYIISNQLLRCGTSIGACISEGSAAQTRKDFITKMSIASKEARETLYWLKLIQTTGYDTIECVNLIAKTEEIVKLLTSTVKTAQLNSKNNNTKH